MYEKPPLQVDSPESESEIFEKKKRDFFIQLGLRVREALKMHKEVGLWEPRGENKRDWGNVSEHCLVEAARAEVLGEKISLSPEMRNKMVTAAALHDFYKKDEITRFKTEGYTWANMEQSAEEGERLVRDAGFDDIVTRLSGAMGWTSLEETEQLLSQEALSEEDWAFLVIHYIDDYTINEQWANPVEAAEDGRLINDLDRRIAKNASYSAISEGKGNIFLDGKSALEAQLEISRRVEELLTMRINSKGEESFDPIQLPTIVDEAIKEKINGRSL